MNLENLNKDEQFFRDSISRAGIPTTQQKFENKFAEIADAEGVPFANPSEISPFWRFIQTALAAPALWLVAFLVRVVMPANFLKTAQDEALDLKGWENETARKDAQKAQGVITFYRASADTVASIPPASVVRTPPIGGKVYKMVTVEAGNFDEGATATTVRAIAEETGAAYNLAAGYYSIMEKPVTGIVRISNEQNWLSSPGADRENDDDYRARIRAKNTAISDHHTNSVYKTLISQFGGISYERIFIDNTLAPRGPGSADAHVLFDAGEASEQFLQRVNDYINEQGYHGLGDDLQVKAMPETHHDIELTLYYKNGTSEARAAEIEAGAEQIIRAAFRENKEFPDVLRVWPSSRFSLQKLGDSINRRFGDDLESITWKSSDIESGWEIARLQSLTINSAGG